MNMMWRFVSAESAVILLVVLVVTIALYTQAGRRWFDEHRLSRLILVVLLLVLVFRAGQAIVSPEMWMAAG